MTLNGVLRKIVTKHAQRQNNWRRDEQYAFIEQIPMTPFPNAVGFEPYMLKISIQCSGNHSSSKNAMVTLKKTAPVFVCIYLR